MRIQSITFVAVLFAACFINNSMAAESGQSVAFDRKKGNCLACHAIPNDPDAHTPGDIGPPLVGMKSRYPNRGKLRAQIWDATANNPNTSMPPFGKNKILTEQEVDLVTDYIYGI